MIRINLLKPETREPKELAPTTGMGGELRPKKAVNYGSLIFLALVIGLGVFYFMQKRAFDTENELLTQARQEKEQLKYVVARLDELNKQKISLERKIVLISTLKSQQSMAVQIMDDLSRRLPDWVWLTEVGFDGVNIQIKGKALSNNLIAEYIASLEDSPRIMNVNLPSTTQRKTAQNEYYEFALSAVVEKPQAAGPDAKPGIKSAPKKRGTA